MKTEDLTEKQIEDIRIAVAESMGWKRLKDPGWWQSNDGTLAHDGILPNYLVDLNAVREVEMTLGRGLLTEPYLKHLLEVIPSDLWADVVCATALQRCIALVMTLCPDKWTEINGVDAYDRPYQLILANEEA